MPAKLHTSEVRTGDRISRPAAKTVNSELRTVNPEWTISRLAELDESIFECAHLFADLMAVDGALVVNAARDIIGFGAEVHVPTRENEMVFRALDLEAQQVVPERADDAGTRHRAAYRLTRDHPECMVVVVSQDGSVRYLGNPNGKVTYWDVLLI